MHRPVEASIDDRRLQLDPAEVTRLFRFMDTHFTTRSIPPGALAVAFVDERTSSELHLAFFRDDSVTDVMTFPGYPDEGHAGDIAVCPAYAAEHAGDYGHTFAEELTLYLIHGWLHLSGLDDQSDDSAREMRAAERKALSLLRENQGLLEARWLG